MTDEKPKLKVVPFTKKIKEEEPREDSPDEILEKSKGKYKLAIVMGWDTDEEMSYILSDGVTSAEALLLMEVVKADIVSNMFEEQ